MPHDIKNREIMIGDIVKFIHGDDTGTTFVGPVCAMRAGQTCSGDVQSPLKITDSESRRIVTQLHNQTVYFDATKAEIVA